MNYFLLCSFWLYGAFGSYAIAKMCGVHSGEMMVQVVSDPVENIHSLFWSESKKVLYAAELITDKLHIWNYKDAKITNITLIPEEPIAFFIPFNNTDEKAIVGTATDLRIFEGTESNFKVSDPVLKIEEEGYYMYRAQCDSNGVLYILANYLLIDDSKAKGSILYIVKDKKLQQLKKFDSVVYGFTISEDKTMHVITERGKKIMKYNLDANEGKLSDETTFFTVDSVKTFLPFEARSIILDGEDNIFVSIGHAVAKIDKDGKLQKTIRTPFVDTALIFGGCKYSHLFVGTTKLLIPYDDEESGSILAISGFEKPGKRNNLVKW